jgi:hypothetical protein
MPLFSEGRSRSAWRREVAEYLVDRVDAEGRARFVGTSLEDRREMLRIARMLPPDLIAEIVEDPYDARRTHLDVRPLPAPMELDSGFRIIRNDQRGYGREAAG